MNDSMLKTRMRFRFALVVGLVSMLSLSGCFGLDLDPERGSKNHILIMHPPHYEWDPVEKELTGHFMLSNMHPDPDEFIKDPTITRNLGMSVRFSNEDGEVGPRNSWSRDFGPEPVVIASGETRIFNFTFPPANHFRDDSVTGNVTHIRVTIIPSYTYCCNESFVHERNDKDLMYVRGFYNNDCLVIGNRSINQKFDDDWCQPWRLPHSSFSGLFLRIGDLRFPPPEVWLEWDDDSIPPLSDYPQFRERIEFLRNFDLDARNVTYGEFIDRSGLG